jgi:hypothetical protein
MEEPCDKTLIGQNGLWRAISGGGRCAPAAKVGNAQQSLDRQTLMPHMRRGGKDEYGNDVGNGPSDRSFAQKACTRPLGETKVTKKPLWN